MKPDADLKSNYSFHHSNGSHNNNTGSMFTAQRKAAIHDLTQITVENCLKMMTESHRLMSKYHSYLLIFANGHLGESVHNKEELKSLRIQSFNHIKQSLEKLLPQIDNVSLEDNDLAKCLQQILSYLEYLKIEFYRHLYLIRSFYSMQPNDEPFAKHLHGTGQLQIPTINIDQISNKSNEVHDLLE